MQGCIHGSRHARYLYSASSLSWGKSLTLFGQYQYVGVCTLMWARVPTSDTGREEHFYLCLSHRKTGVCLQVSVLCNRPIDCNIDISSRLIDEYCEMWNSSYLQRSRYCWDYMGGGVKLSPTNHVFIRSQRE